MESTVGTKKNEGPNSLNYSPANRHPEAADDLTNLTYTCNLSTATWRGKKYNNNKQNNVITISEIEKSTMKLNLKKYIDVNNRKIKNHPPSPIVEHKRANTVQIKYVKRPRRHHTALS